MYQIIIKPVPDRSPYYGIYRVLNDKSHQLLEIDTNITLLNHRKSYWENQELMASMRGE